MLMSETATRTTAIERWSILQWMTAIVKIASIAPDIEGVVIAELHMRRRSNPRQINEKVDGVEEVDMNGQMPVLELDIQEQMQVRR